MLEDLKELAGFLADIFSFIGLRLNNPRSFNKFLLILKYKKASSSNTFLEVGTFHGVTSRRCSGYFEKVYTVEINQELAKRAAIKFAKLNKRNVHVVEGDGLKRLPEILARNDVLEFLDGQLAMG